MKPTNLTANPEPSQPTLIAGSSYISRFSDLKVTIRAIHYESDSRAKVVATISNATNGIIYDLRKSLTLDKTLISRAEWVRL